MIEYADPVTARVNPDGSVTIEVPAGIKLMAPPIIKTPTIGSVVILERVYVPCKSCNALYAVPLDMELCCPTCSGS